jgi:hypothetical protein
MDAERFIEAAIEKGQQSDAHMLDPLQRTIYLFSELEVLCDMEGIDSFLDHYCASELRAFAGMLHDAGAAAIAESLAQLADALPQPDEGLLDIANDLVTSRAG